MGNWQGCWVFVLWVYVIGAFKIGVIVPLLESTHLLPLINMACEKKSGYDKPDFVFLTSYEQNIDGCSHASVLGIDAISQPQKWQFLRNFTVEEMRIFLLRPFWKSEMVLGGLDVMASHIYAADLVIAQPNYNAELHSFLHTLLLAVPSPPFITGIPRDLHFGPHMSLSAFLQALNYTSHMRYRHVTSKLTASQSLRRPGHMSDSSSNYLSTLARRKLTASQRSRLRTYSRQFCSTNRQVEYFGVGGLKVLDAVSVDSSPCNSHQYNNNNSASDNYGSDSAESCGGDSKSNYFLSQHRWTGTNGVPTNSPPPPATHSTTRPAAAGPTAPAVGASDAASTHRPIRILCLAFTHEPRHESVRVAMLTWASNCDGYLAISNSSEDTSLPLVSLATSPSPEDEDKMSRLHESYQSISIKSRLIWTMVVQSQLIDEYDYFLLAGDDVYVAVENLRSYLRYVEVKRGSAAGRSMSGRQRYSEGSPTNNGWEHDTSRVFTSRAAGADERTQRAQEEMVQSAVFIGRKMKQNALLHFYHGGSGYVLNRKAVSVLNDLFTHFPRECLTHVHTSMEDVMNSRCLLYAGIVTDDVLDPFSSRHIFHPLHPADAFAPAAGDSISPGRGEVKDENSRLDSAEEGTETVLSPWEEFLLQVASYGSGSDCCSEFSVSFQNLLPEHMLCLHHRLYGWQGNEMEDPAV